jgi:two-component system sensor histidine kinase/response regulator
MLDCLVDVIGTSAAEKAFSTGKAQRTAALSPARHAILQKIRILLVDDNIVNRNVALGLLKKVGCNADAVANGLEVLDALDRINYDVIFMDCQMPEMDGFDATRLIRKRERSGDWCSNRNTPFYIIALTASAMSGDREKCLAAGMNDYLSKPVTVGAIEAALERWQLLLSRCANTARQLQPAVTSVFVGQNATCECG